MPSPKVMSFRSLYRDPIRGLYDLAVAWQFLNFWKFLIHNIWMQNQSKNPDPKKTAEKPLILMWPAFVSYTLSKNTIHHELLLKP